MGKGIASDPTAATEMVTARLKLEQVEENAQIAKLFCVFEGVPIPRGKVVKTECYVATTGARFIMEALRGSYLTDTTEDVNLEVEHMVSKTDEFGVVLEPSVEASLDAVGDLKAEMGDVSIKKGEERRFKIVSREAVFVRLRLDESRVRWVFDLPRVEFAVRDFLAIETKIQGTVHRVGDKSSKFLRVAVKPKDRRFFNGDYERLSRLASWGLAVVLWYSERELPSASVKVAEV